jgi:hypothetical protein
MGPAAMVAGLVAVGYEVTMVGQFAVFAYRIEVGSRIGEVIRLGLEAPGDWPTTAPHGPHLTPKLGHPGGGVHASPLGEQWEHWSRPVPDWDRDRSVRGYLRHLRSLFAQV